MARVLISICLLCVGGAIFARAETFSNAMQLLSQARAASDSPAKLKLYEDAAAQFEALAATSSNPCPPRILWAVSLVELARAHPAETRGQPIVAAKSQLAAVDPVCPGSWLVQDAWGRLLLFEVEMGSLSAEAATVQLQAALERFAKAREAATLKSERAQAEWQASLCLVRLAEREPHPKRRAALHAQAIQFCESASQVPGFERLGQVYATWGVVLVESGKLAHDRRVLRQGVERLQRALQLDATDAQSRYNLACVYALLGQTALALEELRTCLGLDPSGRYRNAARREADFRELRIRNDFWELVGDEPDRKWLKPVLPSEARDGEAR